MSTRQGSLPLTQETHSTLHPQPYPTLKNGVERRGHLLLSHLVNGGVRRRAGWSTPHIASCRSGGSLGTAPLLQASTPSRLLLALQGPPAPHRNKDSVREAASQLLEELLHPPPLMGVRPGLGAKEYIHVARQGAGAFSITPRPSPKMAAVGEAPQQAWI